MSQELQQEQQRVDQVIGIIQDQINEYEEATARRRQEVVDIRKHFWEDVTVNTDNFDDFLETIISLRQQSEVLSLSQGSHRQSSKRLSQLQRMQDVPYFGRIDFAEEGMNETERVYIGVSSLTDATGEKFLIYDWRAPVSSMYYDCTPGPAEYITPGGPIQGTLEQKWQYIIRSGVIQSMFDTRLTIGDEILQQVLGQSADTHMRSIVATIQQEQNRIIRHDSARLLIVQGAAGSGKTSAALQRIAYLLYKYRNRLTADQMLLFSPNAMFKSYVSSVLPELGEENMQQVTFQEYLNHRLSGFFDVEDPYTQLEYVLTASEDPNYRVRMAGIRFKATKAFFDRIQSCRQALEQSGMVFKDISFKGKTLVSAEEILERFYSEHTTLRFTNRLEKLSDWLKELVKEAEKAERRKPWVQDAVELVDNDEYQQAYAHLRKKHGLTEESEEDVDLELVRKELARRIVSRKFKRIRQQIKDMGFIDTPAIYKQMLVSHPADGEVEGAELPSEWNEIGEMTSRQMDQGKLLYEDATPYLLLKELIEGFQTNVSIRHVLVDEAQDYSPFQFEFIKRLFPAAKMTVLGDFNQAVFAHADGTDDFGMLAELYGEEQTDAIILNRSYRSTRPIVEFTRALIPKGEEIIPFDRNGSRPVLTRAADAEQLHQSIREKVKQFREQGHRTVAIICKSAAQSASVFESLRDLEDIKLVTSGSIEYKQGIVVIPVYLAKGIEFDAVIVYNASDEEYREESLRRLFYTACTRAMHELQLYSIGKPSRFVQEAASWIAEDSIS